MGLFDVFDSGPGRQAASRAFKGYESKIDAGRNLALDAYGTGEGKAEGYLTDAVGQFGDIYDQEMLGRGAYLDYLGLNGQEGYDRALDVFHEGPGYNWLMDQGLEGINRGRAGAGLLDSGNADIDRLKFATGLADQTWQQHGNRLQGFNPMAPANAQAQGLTNLGELMAQGGRYRGNIFNESYGKLADARRQLEADKFAAKRGAEENEWNAVAGLLGLGTNILGMGLPTGAGGVGGGTIGGSLFDKAFG